MRTRRFFACQRQSFLLWDLDEPHRPGSSHLPRFRSRVKLRHPHLYLCGIEWNNKSRGPCLGLLPSKPPYLHQSSTRRSPRLILIFWLAGLRILIGKMAFLVTIVTSVPTHIPIFPMHWLVAATMISNRSLGCVDSNGRGEGLRPGAARAVIATIPIVPIFLVFPARSLWDLSSLGTIRRHGLCLLGAE